MEKFEYSETFERICEDICSSCISSDDDLCGPFDSKSCPYWSDMEDLHALCVKVDSLYESVLHRASTRDAYEIYHDGCLAHTGV